ncbi:hypothetical protein [Hyphomicrobium sp. DY-1]|uniref:hypothetical protein n=1 Tax=Hyphomicrobium sp. DY-1 TaxID=3075650 RepID=UPI0039C29445
MYRKFEELGITLGGASYGFFSGEAEFDVTGHPVAIEVEAAAVGQPDLRLDIAELVRERIGLRDRFGLGFLEDSDERVRAHVTKWMLFHALADSLVERYREDIEDELSAARALRGTHAA